MTGTVQAWRKVLGFGEGQALQTKDPRVMKAGLFINTQFPESVNVGQHIPAIIEQVRAARVAGFASLWFPHHWLTHPIWGTFGGCGLPLHSR
jgi:hypothetical protein